ncbi:MAG: tetratricopeptide repeat protein [Campylobacter sp.]
MKKEFIFTALFGAVFLFSEEVSVFDAGNVNSENLYGLTENEQILLKNKQRLDQIQSTLRSQEDNIEGLRSVIEGSNKQISNLEQRLSDVEIRATGKSNSNKVSTINKQEIAQMQYDIAWIKEQIKIINSKLANSTAQQKKNDVDFKKKSDTQDIENQTQTTQNIKQNAQKSSAEILKEADELYKNKKYTYAKELYSTLKTAKFQPAKVNFMLGEIAYFEQDYNNALSHYKASLNLSDKSEFMPKLLYHSAISLDKIGDTKNANKFYLYLKSKFPNSKEASAAPNRK